MDPWKLGAVEAANKISRRDLSPSELVESVLARIEATNPRLNAMTSVAADQATAQAKAADQAVVDGAELGPLHGVPVTIKVNIDVAGEATTNGVPALADLVATEDAPLVTRLREAGAIVIGRTNTPEFSMRATTDNPLHGRTLSPWDDDASPGGSSGGAGVACVTGMGALHHGNDIGGSLRFPSFMNGVMTIKPSSYRIPVYNGTAPAERGPLAGEISVQGIIARHTEDVVAATKVMIQPDPRDPLSPPLPWQGPPVENPKVAVTKASAGYDMHPGIAALVDQAAGWLADAGYHVEAVDPPDIAEAAAGWFSTLITEMKMLMGPGLAEFGSETINRIFGWYFEISDLLDLEAMIRGSADRTRLKRDWHMFSEQYPLVVTPFLMRPTPDWDYDARGLAEVTDLFESAVYSTGINYLGLPAGVIGTGLVDGRPAGVQIVGRRWREDLIADALAVIEAASDSLAAHLWRN